jgi:hypothetical protein
MGASGWAYFVPFQEDVEQALQELRQAVFEHGAYFKPAEFYGSILESEIGKNMAPHFREQLAADVANMLARPKPETIDEVLEQNGESGTHSILDIQTTASFPDFGVAAPLSPQELSELFGTEEPTAEMIQENINGVQSLRSRWEGTYIIVYKEGTPSEIFFTGFSGD